MKRSTKILSLAIELNKSRKPCEDMENRELTSEELLTNNILSKPTSNILDFIEDQDDFIKDKTYIPSDDSDSTSSITISESIRESATQIENLISNNESEEITNINSKENNKTRKIKRNSGKQYTSKNGKLVQERTIQILEDCRKKCKNKISVENQREIFKNYWALGSYQARQSYVSGLIEVQDTKFPRLKKSDTIHRNRFKTNYYFLEIRGQRISVCQKCFRFTFGESEQFIKTVTKKMLECSGPSTTPDGRGHHSNHRKISLDNTNQIISFIEKFPAYESHYTRRDSSKKYLPSNLSVAELYRLYCDELHYKHVSISKFMKIFQSLNLSFKKPKTDTCHKCDVFKMKIDVASEQEQIDLKTQHKQHLEDADIAYLSKDNDKKKSLQDQTIKTFAFDLQQCLPTPLLQSSVSFYKRPLWTFNLTVHNLSTGQPFCYMWHEATANRGGNEIASCLYQHLQTLSSITKHIIFYSDCCVGQNKNGFVATMFQTFMQGETNNVEIIDHKFLIPGHTHMECDVDHSLIERKKKKTLLKIHHPRDWYQFVRSVGVKVNFVVTEMTKDTFYNFSLLSKQRFTWRKTSENGKPFCWQNIRWLRYTKNFGTILYKTTLNENDAFEHLNLRRRGINGISPSDLQIVYKEDNAISSKKKKDLIDMLPLIDNCYHSFYNNLKTEEVLDFHPDLTEED